MNHTTFGNTSCLSLLFCDNLLNTNVIMIPSVVSLILRLPASICILQLIISRDLMTSEFCALNEAIVEMFICVYDILGVAACAFPDPYLMEIRRFFRGFIIIGRPFLLALICVERYLAVVKPVVFLRLKPLKYKLALSGIIWLWTLVSCSCLISTTSVFHYSLLVAQIIMCFVVKLYCCIGTLLVLKQPGPGESVRQREGMSNIKQKAFRIILILTISVILVYVPLVVIIILKHYMAQHVFQEIMNVCYTCSAFSGLVQALLFLQRSGKLPFIKWP